MPDEVAQARENGFVKGKMKTQIEELQKDVDEIKGDVKRGFLSVTKDMGALRDKVNKICTVEQMKKERKRTNRVLAFGIISAIVSILSLGGVIIAAVSFWAGR